MTYSDCDACLKRARRDCRHESFMKDMEDELFEKNVEYVVAYSVTHSANPTDLLFHRSECPSSDWNDLHSDQLCKGGTDWGL
eukprot:CAMPEP_0181439432 /NCGR_PEP_ID=MMETSP1110-20121109/22424_1 /TAXON_ID=174948 /ORGANISM="Symbiodinium sp., Strain CCMP421" /LENGTH=81 /DNA_ID=CAMNT_0023563155 /DNA_START=440 /DNA_END=685 /DNA_ORIENTATION=-